MSLNKQILTVLRTNRKGFDNVAKADVLKHMFLEWCREGCDDELENQSEGEYDGSFQQAQDDYDHDEFEIIKSKM